MVDQILEEIQSCEVLRARRVASEEAGKASWGLATRLCCLPVQDLCSLLSKVDTELDC